MKSKFVLEGNLHPEVNLKNLCLCDKEDEFVHLVFDVTAEIQKKDLFNVLKSLEADWFGLDRENNGRWRLTLERIGDEK